jgi:tRNA modification GTPase
MHLAQIEHILSDRSLWWLLHPPRVAIVGAPNAGKSTLANQLFAQERSITADLPGTTRDWVGEIANIDGLAVMLIDTPGQRETSDQIESEAIRRSAAQIETADLVLLVLDASRPLEPQQSPLLLRHPQAIRVINKIDKSATWDWSSIDGIATIATSGHGTSELRSAIQRHFGCHQLEIDRPRCWTERQRQELRRILVNQKIR